MSALSLKESANPVLVEVTRGDMVESFHRGAAAVVDASGKVLAQFGDITRPVYPRSAIKPLQAFVLVESGAIERFGLGDEHIALACASHSGQASHVNRVRQWLGKLGLDETHLECGTQDPADIRTRDDMILRGIRPTALNNNCSGKHAGFVTVASHDDLPIKGYIEREHPIQQRVLRTVAELTDESLHDRPTGVDGCGIPVTAISLYGTALAFARIAAGNFDTKTRRDAALRIRSAMSEFPGLVGGENRFCTAVPTLTENRVLVKVGAEGVYAGLMPEAAGLGLALKIDDGSRRAAEVAMGWLIATYCRLKPTQLDHLKSWFQPEVKTVAKNHAGIIRPALK